MLESQFSWHALRNRLLRRSGYPCYFHLLSAGFFGDACAVSRSEVSASDGRVKWSMTGTEPSMSPIHLAGLKIKGGGKEGWIAEQKDWHRRRRCRRLRARCDCQTDSRMLRTDTLNAPTERGGRYFSPAIGE